jgi:hypothetical protein
MSPSSLLPRGRRSLSALVLVGLLAVITALGLQTASASKDAPAVPAPPTQPTRADQIQNIDQVKTAIKAYYGDTVQGTTPFGTPNHVPAADGAYAHEVAGLARTASKYLQHPSHGKGKHDRGAKAILLDVDDTSLNTYNYEIYSNFVYDPVSNGRFVDAAAFPAVPAMADLAQKAQRDGYTVFFLTGRPEAQRPGTEQNLTEKGFPVRTDRVFLKNDAGQAWITCDTEYTQYDTAADRTKPPACNTIERKSQTRRHIERDLGYDIAANFGDQFSDLTGGYADRTFKLPNPMYYLP